MLYYDKEKNKTYNERSLNREGKSPNDPSVFPLYKVIPSYNYNTQYLNVTSSVEKVEGENYYKYVYEILDRPIGVARDNLTKHLSSIRYNHEVSGTTTDTGVEVLTDRNSQSMTLNAYQSLATGLIAETEWKSPDGWITVTTADLEPIASAVADHVRKCFTAERSVADMIGAAETVDELTPMNLVEEFESAYSAV